MILKQKYYLINFTALSLLFFALSGCKKTDQFYDTLQSLPQVNSSTAYAYKPAYIVGDTMVIIGRLQPKNNLQITIGSVSASIIKADSVPSLIFPTYEDRVSLLITDKMAGGAREVKITTGGYSTLGSAIDVYTPGGEGSFNSPLKSVQLTTLSSAYQFLYCANGKGDVYYYAPATKDLHHIKKDGTQEVVYDLSGSGIIAFMAGGIDPTGKFLYYSIQTPSGYGLFRLDLQTKTPLLLNQSAALSSPYEGAIGSVHLIVTGIYPDANGNVYLGVGLGNQDNTPDFLPDAIASYNAADGHIAYIYKNLFYGSQLYTDMPGVNIASNILSIRFNPDENLLYAVSANPGSQVSIMVFNLSITTLVQELKPSNTTGTLSQFDVIAPFNGLKINLGTGNAPESAFGFMPMPHQRLQVLLFQHIDGSIFNQGTTNVAGQLGFPKWIAFDFANQRTYAYGLGKFQLGNNGNYELRNTDQLLNYDEEGNLYMTGNGKSYLLKTQAQ